MMVFYCGLCIFAINTVGMREIPLTQGKVALVDDEDYDYLMQWKWKINNDGYAVAYTRDHLFPGHSRPIKIASLMHREIFKHPLNLIVDHIDGDRLNNTRVNLRICTQSENSKNRCVPKNNKSGFKGVCWSKRSGKWVAQLTANGRVMHLGLFTCPTAAALVYNAAAIKHHGEFAKLNQIPPNGQ